MSGSRCPWTAGPWSRSASTLPRGSVQAAEFQLPGVAPGQHPRCSRSRTTELTRDNRFCPDTRSQRGKTAVLPWKTPGPGAPADPQGFSSRTRSTSPSCLPTG